MRQVKIIERQYKDKIYKHLETTDSIPIECPMSFNKDNENWCVDQCAWFRLVESTFVSPSKPTTSKCVFCGDKIIGQIVEG